MLIVTKTLQTTTKASPLKTYQHRNQFPFEDISPSTPPTKKQKSTSANPFPSLSPCKNSPFEPCQTCSTLLSIVDNVQQGCDLCDWCNSWPSRKSSDKNFKNNKQTWVVELDFDLEDDRNDSDYDPWFDPIWTPTKSPRQKPTLDSLASKFGVEHLWEKNCEFQDP